MTLRFEVGAAGLSAATVARKAKVSAGWLVSLCRSGRIVGAALHPLTRKWWIYRPAMVVQASVPVRVKVEFTR